MQNSERRTLPGSQQQGSDAWIPAEVANFVQLSFFFFFFFFFGGATYTRVCVCVLCVTETWLRGVPTAQQLHPGAGLVNGGGVAEEEERHAGDAAEDQHHGQQHEHRGRLEGSGRDGAEVGEAAHAGELPAGRRPGAHAVVEEAEVAGLRRVDAVADPVGLDEHHHVDDGEADGEDGPQHPDGPGVAHVIVMVDLGGFLGRQHVWSIFFFHSLSPSLSLSFSFFLSTPVLLLLFRLLQEKKKCIFFPPLFILIKKFQTAPHPLCTDPLLFPPSCIIYLFIYLFPLLRLYFSRFGCFLKASQRAYTSTRYRCGPVNMHVT